MFKQNRIWTMIGSVLFAFGTAQAVANTMDSASVDKASDLIGQTVESQDGEELGEIDDVALDLESGEISYVVLSVGGMMSQKLVALPVDALEMSPEQDGTWIASVSKSEIESAEGFDSENWPAEPTLATAGAGAATGLGTETGTETGTDTGLEAETGAGVGAGSQSTAGVDFTELDQDQSGYLTPEEVSSENELAASYEEIDSNSDGRVDRAEFAAFESQGSTMQQSDPSQTEDDSPMDSPMDEEGPY